MQHRASGNAPPVGPTTPDVPVGRGVPVRRAGLVADVLEPADQDRADVGRSGRAHRVGVADQVDRDALRRPSVRGRLAALVDTVAIRGGVSPRAVVGLFLIGAAVVVVLGLRLAVVSSRAQPVPLRAVRTAPAVEGAATRGGAFPTPTNAASVAGVTAGAVPGVAAGVVLVDVVGQVRHAGVVRLPAGSRVEQALAAAGGATSHADLVRVNLARPVMDGEQIVVPRPGQPLGGAPDAGASSAGKPGDAASGAGGAGAVVDLNTAGLSELDSLPGVGPVLAQRILDWRSSNGRFHNVDELGEVSGIGEKVLAQLRPRVRV